MAGVIRVEYRYTWKIENYFMCYRKHGVSLKSPIFTPNNCGGSKWYLEVYPSGRKSKEFQSCVLSRCDEDFGAEVISVAFIIEVSRGSGNIITTLGGNNSTKYEFKRGTSYGLDNVVIKDWKEDNLTISCQLFSFLPTNSGAVTEVEMDRCSFTWTVDFDDCLADRVARKFSFSKAASQYEIAVTFPNDEIEIKICELEGNTSPSRISGKICLLGQKDLSHFEKHLFETSDDGNGTWIYPSFILGSELELEDNKYMKDGAFSLFCEFSKASGKEQSRTVSSTDSNFTTKINNIVTLHSDLKNILSLMKYSDVELRAEDVTLPAHKTFLSARSPVFSAMFDQDMIENKLDIVDITDIDLATLKSFLEFLYTGNVVFQDCSSALKLLMAAEKYQVLSLKETCTEYLMPALSVENVCEILGVADLVNLKQLEKCTLDYIAKHIAEISNSSGWPVFLKTNAELTVEIFSYIATHFKLKPREN